MRKSIFLSVCSLWLLTSCLNEGEEETLDLAPPSIVANEGLQSIKPSFFFKTDAVEAAIPLSFKVEDLTGIREIKFESHSGFDGHTHGKFATARNRKFKLFSHNEVIRADQIENPNSFSYTGTIYTDARNPSFDVDDLILAGPYHFSIQATDVLGNETNYRDNTTYHTTLYVNRPYAPQVEIQSLSISTNSIDGKIYRNRQEDVSADINFLWIYVQAPSAPNSGQEGAILSELLWGKSNWPHQFRANEGAALPNTQEINIGQLLNGNTSFFQALRGNLLVVWAEDTNGNITVNQFNN